MEAVYINENSESITFTSRRPFFLRNIDGIGNVKQEVSTFKAPGQDGAFYISSTLEMRNITLEGTVLTDTIDLTFEARKQFLRILTPKQKGTLMVRNKRISCIVEEVGFIAANSQKYPGFFISFVCPSPFFEDLNETHAEIAAWLGAFSFPLEIPEMSGMQFGIRQPSQIITVDNAGDVSCGCTIVFKATGTLSNPELLNVGTGEVMRILKTLVPGEEIHVNTHFAAKKVTSIIGKTTVNAFPFMDTASTFLGLAPGENILRYDAETGMDLLETSVYYRSQYLGI